jgi:EAL domain-containing protein (putative c-di-GMP-specific phosphodiesterase class I)/CheY-like chemotaxis protein
VLILDDEAAIRQLIRAAIPGDQFDVVDFGDIATAAKAAANVKPTLIFLDLELGSGDAIEAFRAFAEKCYRGNVQLVSGRGEGVLNTVKAIGDRYGFRLLPPITKPFRIRQIRQALTDVTVARGDLNDGSDAGPADRPIRVTAFPLEEALSYGWLELWYQPKLDLRTGLTTGAEGLIRARHPDLGIVSPGAFLPGASDEALSRLTEFVLIAALRDWNAFFEAGRPLRLCVNAPASALLTAPIADMIRQHRPRTEAFPGLVLEITEDQALQSIPLAQEVAAQLGIYGVELSLDDFGQGHSSLARLRDLPFTSLKIDHSFVAGCDQDSVKREFCKTIVDMAHRFGCAVVAEGIETAAELAVVRELGCEYGQGYLLGRPMPKEELILRLRGEASGRSDARPVTYAPRPGWDQPFGMERAS